MAGFGLENLPFGIVARAGEPGQPAVRYGDDALLLAPLDAAGLLGDLPPGVLSGPVLNPFLALGRPAWSGARARLTELLEAGDERAQLVPLSELEVRLPLAIGDYVDFYSSIEHATNLGRMFRPEAEPLLPNWRHLPVGYHGRAGSVIVSGTPVRRPCGQLPPPEPGAAPRFGPSERLDIELELGFVTGPGNALGTPIASERGARADLRLRAGQRLERARHPALGVPAARAVPRQVVRDLDLAVDRAARGARAVPRGGAAAGPRAAALPAGGRRLGARPRARGRARAGRRGRGDGDLAHERPRPVLDRPAAARPRDRQRRRRSAPATCSRPARSRARSRAATAA